MESLIYAFEGRKSFLTDQCFESSWDETNNIRSVKSRNSASTATLNSVMEFGTIFSCSANEEKLAAPSKLNGTRFATENLVLSTPEPSVSAKRARIMSSQSSIPTCQVLGCNKDLSSSKDYHKRHKVCDVHSKTAVVIVNGIQQRFCQQCSRFHILAEFDEGKRSCRKRLAGHNERRRKPQFDNYLGSTYLSTDASKTSLLFPGSSFYGVRCNKPINHSRHLKFEHDPCQISQKFAANMKFGQSLLNPIMKKQSPSKHHGLNNNTPLSVPESSVGSNSSGALSLLSVQSHTAHHPLISEENYRSTLCTVQNSAIPNLCTSEDFTPMIFNACGVHQGGLTFVPDDISQNEISQNFSDINQRSYFSPDCSETVSLLELSLHLQRVEQQKSQENHVSGNSTYT